MRNYELEKRVKKIDREIEALKVASKYLSNTEEINEVKVELNKKRQVMIDDLYRDDAFSYRKCREILGECLNREIGKEEQKEILERVKDIFGRQSPNSSKESNGLNAWLKKLDIECNWIANEGEDWATLVITEIKPPKQEI